MPGAKLAVMDVSESRFALADVPHRFPEIARNPAVIKAVIDVPSDI